jgi:GT2 family glycosyltransferase
MPRIEVAHADLRLGFAIIADRWIRMSTTPELSIIIVNYNGTKFLQGCLDSIQRFVTCPYEVILVDNCSADGSCDFVQLKYPWVKLIRSSKNLGFAAGSNLGATLASGQFILLFNNDTVLHSDLDPAISFLKANPHVGVLGADMLNSDLVSKPCTGLFPNPLRLIKFSRLFIRPGKHKEQFAQAAWIVDWVQGSFLLTTANNWHELGGLDDKYFMYVEDIDFCKRSSLRGLLTVYYTDVRYVHYGGYDGARWNLLYSGHQRYQKKFHRGVVGCCSSLVLRVGLIVRLIVLTLVSSVRGPNSDTSKKIEGILRSFGRVS